MVIESVKAAGDIKSPFSGTIIEVNEKLSDEPEKVNEDPIGEGWFYRIQLSSDADLDSFMDESAYQNLVSSLD